MGTMLELSIDLTEQELAEVKQELALALYQRQAVSLAKGAAVA